ncbi:MAG: flagellar basal body-associated FliL family protein [bacterium]|nr:flagellar basal body-associated FliL family protein [bacterium]
MKKNITSIIIIALLGLNVVLSSIILFAMVPSLNKVNTLVTKVANAVDLDLGNLQQAGAGELTIADKTVYTMTGNLNSMLKTGTDGKMHYVAVDSIAFTLNNKAESFNDVNNNIASYETNINDVITSVFGEYTIDEVSSKQDEIKLKVMEGVSQLFSKADCFVDVTFSNLRYQ